MDSTNRRDVAKEAELDARIRRIQEANRKREARRKEVEQDRMSEMAAGSDEARVSVYVRPRDKRTAHRSRDQRQGLADDTRSGNDQHHADGTRSSNDQHHADGIRRSNDKHHPDRTRNSNRQHNHADGTRRSNDQHHADVPISSDIQRHAEGNISSDQHQSTISRSEVVDRVLARLGAMPAISAPGGSDGVPDDCLRISELALSAAISDDNTDYDSKHTMVFTKSGWCDPPAPSSLFTNPSSSVPTTPPNQHSPSSFPPDQSDVVTSVGSTDSSFSARSECMSPISALLAQRGNGESSLHSTGEISRKSMGQLPRQSTVEIQGQMMGEMPRQSTGEMPPQSTGEMPRQSTREMSRQSTVEMSRQSTVEMSQESTGEMSRQDVSDTSQNCQFVRKQGQPNGDHRRDDEREVMRYNRNPPHHLYQQQQQNIHQAQQCPLADTSGTYGDTLVDQEISAIVNSRNIPHDMYMMDDHHGGPAGKSGGFQVPERFPGGSPQPRMLVARKYDSPIPRPEVHSSYPSYFPSLSSGDQCSVPTTVSFPPESGSSFLDCSGVPFHERFISPHVQRVMVPPGPGWNPSDWGSPTPPPCDRPCAPSFYHEQFPPSFHQEAQSLQQLTSLPVSSYVHPLSSPPPPVDMNCVGFPVHELGPQHYTLPHSHVAPSGYYNVSAVHPTWPGRFPLQHHQQQPPPPACAGNVYNEPPVSNSPCYRPRLASENVRPSAGKPSRALIGTGGGQSEHTGGHAHPQVAGRALVARKHPPPTPQTRPKTPPNTVADPRQHVDIQCVTFVDGKRVESAGLDDKLLSKNRDVRLSDL